MACSTRPTSGQWRRSRTNRDANSDGASRSRFYAQFDSLCANIKASGITVYTVGFDLNDVNALAHLETCASSADSFYDVKTGKQLKDAFKAIADRLGNLRVAG